MHTPQSAVRSISFALSTDVGQWLNRSLALHAHADFLGALIGMLVLSRH